MAKLHTWKERMKESCFYGYNTYGGPDMGDVYEFMYRNRDSKCIDESNFEAAMKIMDDAWAKIIKDKNLDIDKPYEIVRFGDFAYGWFEVIHLEVSAPEEIIKVAEDIIAFLECNCILDEEDLSKRELEAAQKFWNDISYEEKIFYCEKADVELDDESENEVPWEIISYLCV